MQNPFNDVERESLNKFVFHEHLIPRIYYRDFRTEFEKMILTYACILHLSIAVYKL